MTTIPQKTCTRCEQTKPLDQFNKDKSRRDGHRDRCKDCIRAYQATWLPRYVEQVQALRTELALPKTKPCTACGIEKPLSDFHQTPNTADGHRPICKTCACDYQHEHRTDPRYAEKVRAGDFRKYHNQPTATKKRKSQLSQTRHKNRFWSDAQYREIARARATHKSNNRRLKRTQNGGSHTLSEWNELCATYNHCCLCCGLAMPLTRDHIVPVDRGGTDDISNIQPLCRPCNSAKGTQTIDYRP